MAELIDFADADLEEPFESEMEMMTEMAEFFEQLDKNNRPLTVFELRIAEGYSGPRKPDSSLRYILT